MKRLCQRACLAAILGTVLSAHAQNPIIQTKFTADPAPFVKDGTDYLYAGHDEDDAPDNKYLMRDYPHGRPGRPAPCRRLVAMRIRPSNQCGHCHICLAPTLWHQT